MSKIVELLTSKFSRYKIDAYLIPSTDEFLNEYVPEHNRRLKYVTGFSGSAGTVIITKSKSCLLTDGRYTLQAKNQLPQNFEIVEKISNSKVVANLKIGYDPMTISKKNLHIFEATLGKTQSSLIPIEENLVDQIWKDRPKASSKQALLLNKKYAGRDAKDKINIISKNLEPSSDYLLLTNPDSICWLLNIRAHDIPYTPLLLSYLILERKSAKIWLFTDKKKVTHIKGYTIKDTSEIRQAFKDLIKKKCNIQCDETRTPIWFFQYGKDQIVNKPDPCALAKAVKNKTEIEGIIDAHLKDGVALTKFLYWLDHAIAKQKICEISGSEKLLELRKEQKLFQYPSFESISAYGKNGAIIHYAPTLKTNQKIAKTNLYLIDSGGQYLNGTTDVTRTVILGKATSEHKKYFTLVLKSHIALASQKFPHSSSGYQLDSIARQHLWNHGLDYPHGTGHGVGHFLSVHEGPQNVGRNGSFTNLEENMIISIEPGFYKANKFGIRIENLYCIKQSKNKNFLEFQYLTLVPIALNLVDMKVLSPSEKKWLKEYNSTVYKKLAKYLKDGEKKWLRKFSNF
jgi:Xaa-Pro aminopeptidase